MFKSTRVSRLKSSCITRKQAKLGVFIWEEYLKVAKKDVSYDLSFPKRITTAGRSVTESEKAGCRS